VLRDVEGLSTEETADALDLSIPAVKSRLLRARLQLRERLSRFFQRRASSDGKPKLVDVEGELELESGDSNAGEQDHESGDGNQ
jgi:predicted RNA polymerase sigma factor